MPVNGIRHVPGLILCCVRGALILLGSFVSDPEITRLTGIAYFTKFYGVRVRHHMQGAGIEVSMGLIVLIPERVLL